MPGIMPPSAPKPIRPPRPGGGPCAKRLAAVHSPTRIKLRFIDLPPSKWWRSTIPPTLDCGGEAKSSTRREKFFEKGAAGAAAHFAKPQPQGVMKVGRTIGFCRLSGRRFAEA